MSVEQATDNQQLIKELERQLAEVQSNANSLSKEVESLTGANSTLNQQLESQRAETHQMQLMLEQIQRGTAAKPESCQAMLQHLESCDDDTMLAAQLPKGTGLHFQINIPKFHNWAEGPPSQNSFHSFRIFGTLSPKSILSPFWAGMLLQLHR